MASVGDNDQDYTQEYNEDDSQQYDGDAQQCDNEFYDNDNENENNDDQLDDEDDDDPNAAADDDNSRNENQNQSPGSGGGIESPKYIRLRGLPWSATHQEILDFLKNVNVISGAKGIHLVTSRWDGKNTGEAYVEVQSQQDVDRAIKLNKASMGHRYIEVFTANPKEAKDAMRKTGNHGTSYVVKLRGLPYAVTEKQIEDFFNGLDIKPDREGIIFVTDRRGRATGEAFVQFESQEDTEQALGRNREKIGHRYIEIFRSSFAELKRSTGGGNGRPGPYDIRDRGGNRGNSDFGGRNDWIGNNGSFGMGANNTLGFNNLPSLMNSGNFGNGFGPNNSSGSGGGAGGGNGGNFGNFGNNGNFSSGNNGNFGNNVNFGNTSGNFGNNANFGNSGGGGSNNNGNFNNFSSNSNSSSANYGGSNRFGDFGNFGNNRGGGNNKNSGPGAGNGGGNFGNFGNFGNSAGGSGPGNGIANNYSSNMGSGGNFGPIGGGRNDNNEFFTIHMRGLPYSSFETDVLKFFDPVRPSNVRINFNNKGQHSGTADVYFETYEDIKLAMERHRDQMGSRYIELFFDGKTKVGSNSSGGNGGGGGAINNSGGGGGGGSLFSRRI